MSQNDLANRADAAAEPLMSKRQIWTVIISLMLALLLAALDQTIVATALYTIAKQLDPVHGLSQVFWVVTAYLLAVTVAMPIYGKVSDQFGRKRVLQTAIVLFLVGSALCGLAANLPLLIGFRVLQGLGAGGMMSLAMAAVADMIPPRERGRYSGLGVAVMAGASVAGPAAGGYFTEVHHLFGVTSSWRWVFWLNVPLGIIVLIIIATTLHLPPAVSHGQRKLDLLGSALIIPAVCGLLLVSSWGGDQYAWSSPVIIWTTVASILLLAFFFYWETRAAQPIFAPRLLGYSIFRVASGTLFFVGFATMGSIVYITIYLQVVDQLSPIAAGLHLMPMTVTMAVSSIVAGRLVSRYGRYKIFPVIGTGVAALSMIGISTLAPNSAWLLSAYLLGVGAGLGMVIGIPQVAVQNSVEHRDMGVATSATAFTRSMGQAFGTALFATILTNRLAHYLPASLSAFGSHGDTPSPAQLAKLPATLQHEYITGYVNSADVVFQITAGILALAFVLTLCLKEVPLRKTLGQTENKQPQGGKA